MKAKRKPVFCKSLGSLYCGLWKLFHLGYCVMGKAVCGKYHDCDAPLIEMDEEYDEA